MKIIIEGIPPYDGEYPLDMGRLTNRDIHTIKTITGYMPLEYEEAGEKGDMDFVVALAVIAVRRGGQHQKVSEDAFWDAEIGRIQIDVQDEEAEDSGPPVSAPETLGKHSGALGQQDGEPNQEKTLRLTGTDSSVT